MQDQIIPPARWQFDENVTNVFEDMLKRSIPQYEVMRFSVTDLANAYLPDCGTLVDLGCSRGSMLLPFAARARCIGVDVSQPMLDAAKEQFKSYPGTDIRYCDLRYDYPPEQADVTLSILTLQFVPIEYRLRILRNVYRHTRRAFILVEKVIGASADLDALFVDTYYNLKSHNGYSREQIERKRLSLEGVLVPVTARWNEEFLRLVGFQQVDCFWRWMNFAGWIAVKEDIFP